MDGELKPEVNPEELQPEEVVEEELEQAGEEVEPAPVEEN